MTEPVKSAVERITEILLSIPTEMPADHPNFAPIGRVASEWAHFEHTLDMCIWELADVPFEVGACITAQMMGSSNRLRTIISLSAKSDVSETTIASAIKLLNKSYEVQDVRNRIIHDPWFWVMKTGEVGQRRSVPFKTKLFGFEEVKPTEIAKTIEQIQKLNGLAWDLRLGLFEELSALRGKPPSPLREAPPQSDA